VVESATDRTQTSFDVAKTLEVGDLTERDPGRTEFWFVLIFFCHLFYLLLRTTANDFSIILASCHYAGCRGNAYDSKDRTFMFVVYEKLRQALVSEMDKVPSLDARNGIIHSAQGTIST
jgi:hypothetical protein